MKPIFGVILKSPGDDIKGVEFGFDTTLELSSFIRGIVASGIDVSVEEIPPIWFSDERKGAK